MKIPLVMRLHQEAGRSVAVSVASDTGLRDTRRKGRLRRRGARTVWPLGRLFLLRPRRSGGPS